ncbi:MAG TPA: hypothetical protein VII73_03460 [Caulobacteraceae bacterium]
METAAGRLIRYDIEWVQGGGAKTLYNFRLVDDPAALGRIGVMDDRRRALRALPHIQGYRFVNETSTPHWGWIGLWQKSSGAPETLVIVFSGRKNGNAPSIRVLAKLPLRLSIISGLPGIDSNAMTIDLASDARNGAPLRLIRLTWDSDRLH